MSFNNKTEFKIEIATEAHLEDLYHLVKDQFMTNDPVHSIIRSISKDIDDVSLIRIPLSTKIPQGLSLIAVDSIGNIIGLIENVEFKRRPIDLSNEKQNISALDEVVLMFEDIELQLNSYTEEDNTKEMETRIIVVHKNWRKMGVARELLHQTVRLAKEKGFKQIRVSCTSAYSAKLFENCGFNSVYRINYKELEQIGKLSFVPLEPHTHATGLILKL